MEPKGAKSVDLRWANDRAIRVSFGDARTPEAHTLVRALSRAIEATRFDGLVDIHPAYASVFVVVDPLLAAPDAVEARLRALAGCLSAADLPAPRRIGIPVAYGGLHGPDLDDVARSTGLAHSDVVRRHAEADYTVAFLGFVPGFAYLSGLPEALRTRRLPAPRRRVPPGSLGVAGGQTAVYPLAVPGGWRLIGRTPTALFRADREPPALLEVGDRVSFVPIEAGDYDRLAREDPR